ncbi:MAG: hypothetical protein GX021_05715 [Tissierellia bacterium]|nr:hypothetical protein [Tissierellia bacterium]
MKKVLPLLIIILLLTSSVIIGEGEDEISQIQEILMSITEEEKEILEHLFIQTQEIQEMEREAAKIDDEIYSLEMDIATIDYGIKKEEENYQRNLEALKAVLQTYQRMGPGSYLEIILTADSLTSLIRRINVLRDLTKNTDELLAKIEMSRERLISERNNLDEKVKLLEEKRRILEENLQKKQELVREQEEYLASLQSDRELYLERLEYISLMMEEIKGILKEFTYGFNRIITEGNFPEDNIKLSLTLRGVKGTIDEKVFNDIVNAYEWIPRIEIKFSQGEIQLNAPDKGLGMSGYFEIEDGQTLKFVPEKGSFLDMPLGKGTLDSLFEEGDFTLNFEPLIGKNIVREVNILDGYLEVLVTLRLF